MPEGVIQGGVSYVVAAWGISVVVLAVYAWQLSRRIRRASTDGDRNDGTS